MGSFSGTPVDQETIALDANAASGTTTFYINGTRDVQFQVRNNTGPNTTHVITLQESVDEGLNWYGTGVTVVGVGLSAQRTVIATHVRLLVTTPEGNPTTVDVIIVGK